MEYVRSTPLSLKSHEAFSEKWLQGVLVDDPTVLGLGDLVVKEVERRQPRAGRLDLLLVDPETRGRYEVEIQLGATDEAHIIRTIEYWDIEKTRYPQYEHVAVLVAEDITSRFLNVISLFNKAIPLVAIQMRALEVGGVFTVSATTVLDIARLGVEEDDEPGQATDRAYWIERGSQASIATADGLLDLINEVTPGMALKYNKHYIGLARNGMVDNFVTMRARREHLIAEFRIPRTDELTAAVADSGVDALAYDKRFGHYRMRLSGGDLVRHHDLLVLLIGRASRTPPPVDD